MPTESRWRCICLWVESSVELIWWQINTNVWGSDLATTMTVIATCALTTGKWSEMFPRMSLIGIKIQGNTETWRIHRPNMENKQIYEPRLCCVLERFSFCILFTSSQIAYSWTVYTQFVRMCAPRRGCLISCTPLAWVAALFPHRPSWPWSSQSQDNQKAQESQWGSKSGVKLRKHTAGKEYFPWWGRHACSEKKLNK